MSKQTTEVRFLASLREIPLRERISRSQDMIGLMCKESRPPKMTIPVQWQDEDFYILHTLGDAADRIEGLEKDAARFRWIIDHQATFAQMTQSFAGEALIGLIDNEIQEINAERGTE